MFKKFLFIFIILNLLYLATPALTQASMGQSLNQTADQAQIYQEQNLGVILAVIINIFLEIMGVVFLILIIYGGYTWMTAMGQDDKIKKAKQTITAAVIGLIIIVLSYSLVSFIYYLLNESDLFYGTTWPGTY